jgi:hypothetical protein
VRRLALLLFLAIAADAVPSNAAAQTVERRISGGTVLLAGRVSETLEVTGGAEVRWPAGFGVAGGAGLFVIDGPHGTAWLDAVVHSEGISARRGASVFGAVGVTYPSLFAEGGRRTKAHLRVGANYWHDESIAFLFEVVVMSSDVLVLRVGVTCR